MPCLIHPPKPTFNRRGALGVLGGAGAMLCAPSAWANALYPEGATERLLKVFEAAGGAELGEIAPFRIEGADMPWTQRLMQVEPGRSVSFFLTGRWWLARPLDLWLEPGFVFFARVGQSGPLYNPMRNTGTLVADRAGRIEIARSAGEWANPQGELWTPPEAYQAGDGLVEGVAIAWKGDPKAGLDALRAVGDLGGLFTAERRRLALPPTTPTGWSNHYDFGESGVFSLCGGQEMCCDTRGEVAILRKDIDQPLSEDLALDWRWLVEALPSMANEDTVPTHDYLSIGVEFDDGQDITYLWSAGLPAGHVFRCPLPGWSAVETHVVQRSGLDGLGAWSAERRMVGRDYADFVGGDATRAVRVWLLAVSCFQRRRGACRYADIVVSDGVSETRLL